LIVSGAKAAAVDFILAPGLAPRAAPIFSQRQPNYQNRTNIGAGAN
jgi:hypothetical protein